MSNDSESKKAALEFEHAVATRKARKQLNGYAQLLQNPAASLARSTDEHPEVKDVAVLGYN